ncbi:dienelactone hydrolase family protein [Pusillimonas noertemannii]|uniref:dienelactone hydrolase family protein n=1 Tax=Pusillimonas noertemannii TaxID=305977 RepID=UPI0033425C52
MNPITRLQEPLPELGMLTRIRAAGKTPAVLLLPAVAGLNTYCADVANALADQGYASLALDYYTGTGAPPLNTRAEAIAAVASLSDRAILARVQAGVAHLKSLPEVDPDKLAVLGFCVGGSYSLLAASSMDAFRCAIAFYGPPKYLETNANKPLSPLDAVGDIRCPLLGHYGAADTLIPLEHVQELRDRLKGKPAEIYTYPGAGHAFHEHFRPQVYRPIAAQEAWERSLRYLRWYFGQ